jgi:DNA-binding response OmpR family regulator
MASRPARTPKILLADDEESIQKLLTYPLKEEGYEVVSALDGQEALERFGEGRYDLVILDVMMPKVDGVEVCRRIRARSEVPIVILTAKGDEADKIEGLEVGADDYITKPFSLAEFKSRVKAALRRGGLGDRGTIQTEIESGDLAIDVERRKVKVRGKDVTLTYIEFEILVALASEPGKVMSRKQLLEDIWGASGFRSPRTVDVHMRHLREKLEKNPKRPEYLFTVRGVGYRFRDEEDA